MISFINCYRLRVNELTTFSAFDETMVTIGAIISLEGSNGVVRHAVINRPPKLENISVALKIARDIRGATDVSILEAMRVLNDNLVSF